MNETALKLLQEAATLTQTRGFHAFSYRDLEKIVGIKTASIHYHFPTKNDLALALTQQYSAILQDHASTSSEAAFNPMDALKRYAKFFEDLASGQRCCLASMLLASYEGLEDNVHEALSTFISEQTTWIANTIKEGSRTGHIKRGLSADKAAAGLLAQLQGGLLLARTERSSLYYSGLVRETLSTLK